MENENDAICSARPRRRGPHGRSHARRLQARSAGHEGHRNYGAPGNTPGFGGSSANPNGVGNNGGNGIHNIGGGAPGQGGVNEPDDRPAGNMHGGLAGATGYSK